MPASNLTSLFRKAGKAAAATRSTAVKTTTSAEDVTLKQYVSSLGSSAASPLTSTKIKHSKKSPKTPSPTETSFSKPLSELAIESSKLESSAEGSTEYQKISEILCVNAGLDLVGSPDSPATNDPKHLERVFDIPWLPSLSSNNTSLRRKDVSRERKAKWVFKSTQHDRLGRLLKMCGQKLGSDATLQVFGKLGRESGVKEYNGLMRLCIDTARKTEDEDVALDQIYKAYQLFKSMQEQGFPIEEETYGPFIMYLIDMALVEEFQFFRKVIIDENPSSLSRLAYYEMLLWIKVDNADKIQELCNYVRSDDGGDKSNLQENYLLALCESAREKELMLLLETIDFTKVLSEDLVVNIFKALGRLSLESFAKKFIMELKTQDIGVESISNFIYSYAVGMPNLPVEDVILKSKNLHTELDVTPSSVLYEKIIMHCCDSLKIYMALEIVEQMFEVGLTLSRETFHSILNACDECCEYNLVHRLYPAISRYNLQPNGETFRIMINLSVKMKDFNGAYDMIKDLDKHNLEPKAGMYNAIMAGHFREKNFHGGLMVFKQMEGADVRPDSQTYSYLISNCNREEDIIEYYEEMKRSGIQVTKHVYMALINGYAACGQFEKAKQVVWQLVLDKGLPVKNLNEIKSVLVSALASHGMISDALDLYEEITQAKFNLEPKAIISLIEHTQCEGELSRLLRLLDQLNPDYWVDGCFRVILYCVRYKHLSSAIDLLGKLKDKFYTDIVALEVLFDEVFCQVAEIEPVDLQFGLDLLRAIKEELGLVPSRKSLDFLLGACTSAKDLQSSFLIWKEYQTAGLPYNVLSFVRMYQALLASGNHKSAHKILDKIPQDDPHVRCVITACQTAYQTTSTSKKVAKKMEKKKRKKKKKTETEVG
ncbi:hypothetical protein LguiB_003025 [Lonicera macranthoides]